MSTELFGEDLFKWEDIDELKKQNKSEPQYNRYIEKVYRKGDIIYIKPTLEFRHNIEMVIKTEDDYADELFRIFKEVYNYVKQNADYNINTDTQGTQEKYEQEVTEGKQEVHENRREEPDDEQEVTEDRQEVHEVGDNTEEISDELDNTEDEDNIEVQTDNEQCLNYAEIPIDIDINGIDIDNMDIDEVAENIIENPKEYVDEQFTYKGKKNELLVKTIVMKVTMLDSTAYLIFYTPSRDDELSKELEFNDEDYNYQYILPYMLKVDVEKLQKFLSGHDTDTIKTVQADLNYMEMDYDFDLLTKILVNQIIDRKELC